MLTEINNLRDEFQSLLEFQHQIMHLKDESSFEKTQNIKNSNLITINNTSNQQIPIENDSCKNCKENSFDNKIEKSNFYLPTCETFKRADMTNDGNL